MDGVAATSRPCHKAFNFDLVIAELKCHYPNGHHTKAYKDVQVFMQNTGFEHRQGSGYRSKTPLTDVDVLDIVDRLYTTFPWFVHCVRKFDVTDVGEVYDLAKLFEEYNAAPETARQPQPKSQPKSLLARLEQAKEEAQRNATERQTGPKRKTNSWER